MKYLIIFVLSTLGLFAKEYSYDKLWSEIQNINQLESVESYKLDEFFIMRDAGTFELDGMIYFFKAFDGKVSLALFSGKGNFSVIVPDEYEKLVLQSKFGKNTFDREFSRATFAFTDDFYQFIKNNNKKKSFVISDYSKKKNKTFLDKTSKYLISYQNAKDINTDLGLNFLNGRKGYFLSIISADDNDYSFEIDPSNFEEITLAERKYTGKFRKDQLVSILKFHQREDYLKPAAVRMRSDNSEKDLLSHDIEVNIDEHLDMRVKSTMEISIPNPKTRWLKFSLYSKMEVSSVVVNGKNALFHKGDDDTRSFDLWIDVGEAQSDSIKIIETYYSGNMVRRIMNFIFMDSFTGWYPDFGFFDQAVFSSKFTYPNNYKFIAPGKKILSSHTDSTITESFISDSNEIHTTFSIGPYEISSIKEEGYPQFDVYYYNDDRLEETKLDLLQSYKLYKGLFGDIGLEHFNASEIYSGHGQAFSSFLHLSYSNFMPSNFSDEFSLVSFVSHEMAHQWWGGKIAPLTNRDNWLSEGFAEYSSMMYTQLVLGDNEKFFTHLSKTKEKIIDVSREDEFVLPIIIGSRIGKYYSLMTYHKSAWILHMLRNMMINFNTMDESLFQNMLKDFFNTNKGKGVITQDFKIILDKHFGIDMQWFINQWVYSSDIPSYTFGWKSEKQDNGKYKVTCRVKQENVPTGFKATVPITIDMGSSGKATLRAMVSGDFKEFTLPLMPFEPEEVIFNAFESVLCEVDTDDYDDISNGYK